MSNNEINSALTKNDLLKFEIFQGRPSRHVFTAKGFMITAAIKAPSLQLAKSICEFPYSQHILYMRGLEIEGTEINCKICFTSGTLQASTRWIKAIVSAFNCTATLYNDKTIQVTGIKISLLRRIFTPRHVSTINRYLKGSPAAFIRDLSERLGENVSMNELFSDVAMEAINSAKPLKEEEVLDEEWSDDPSHYTKEEIEHMKKCLLDEEMISKKVSMFMTDEQIVKEYREMMEMDEDDSDGDKESDYEELDMRELRALAKERGIKIPRGATEDDIIELLEEDDAADEDEDKDMPDDSKMEILREKAREGKKRARRIQELRKRALIAGASRSDLPDINSPDAEEDLRDLIDELESADEDEEDSSMTINEVRRYLLNEGWPAEKIAVLDDEAVGTIFNQLY